MSDDLRQLLHSLADRLADSARPTEPASQLPNASATDLLRAMSEALASLASGDLSTSVLRKLEGTPEGTRLGEALARVRELHRAAEGSVAAGTDRIDEVRAAAERAAEAASRQRVALERVTEQLRQVAQRVEELATSATEMAETSDRASLLALNTGIEGLRVGGEVARTLGSLGEELRKLAQRTAGGARELSAGLRGIVDQSRGAVIALEEARNAARQSGEDAARAATSADAARRSDRALAAAVARFHVLDEHTEALVAKLDSQSEQLAEDLARARERVATLDAPGKTAVEAAIARAEQAARGRGAGTP
jgi:methyl-accepting chemotaxis protein